jgi:hypothetical protein
MTTVNLSDGLLFKIHTNKNSSVFRRASEGAISRFNGATQKIGVVYSDYNADKNIALEWLKEHPDMKIFQVAKLHKTNVMDSKIMFCRTMCNSIYAPVSYSKVEDIPKSTPDTDLFFVKANGSSGAVGVIAYTYNNLCDPSTKLRTDAVIQKCVAPMDLIDGHCYKIRVYVLMFNKESYYYTKMWHTVAPARFKDSSVFSEDEAYDTNFIRKMHIISQREGGKFFMTEDLPHYHEINKSAHNACLSFAKTFDTVVNSIKNDEFVVLGLDMVVKLDYSVQIIEVNHRSNYAHPHEIETHVDIPALRDAMILMINGTEKDTDYVKLI